MREIVESKGAKSFTKPALAIFLALAVGIGIGYSYQANEVDKLKISILEANTKASLSTKREMSLLADMHKAGQELALLSQRLSQSQQQAKTTEQNLQTVVASLQAEVTNAQNRAANLAKIVGQDKTEETDTPWTINPTAATPSAKNPAVSRNKELLEKFTQVSDQFARPRVYKHKYLASWRQLKSVSVMASLFLADITVNEDGSTHSVPFRSLQILRNDEVLTFTDLDSLTAHFSKHKIGEEKLLCRLTWEGRNSTANESYPLGSMRRSERVVNTLEVELDRDYANALIEVRELSRSFENLNLFR